MFKEFIKRAVKNGCAEDERSIKIIRVNLLRLRELSEKVTQPGAISKGDIEAIKMAGR